MSCTVDILGLGPSVSLHSGDNITFGVNDIFRIKPVDYVVCVDGKNRFTPERLRVIEDCMPLVLFSQLEEWKTHPSYGQIKIQKSFSERVDLNTAEIQKSIFSPYVAVGLAWRMFHPDTIRVFGVDMTDHKHLTKEKDRILKHWKALVLALNKKGCKVEVHGSGLLV